MTYRVMPGWRWALPTIIGVWALWCGFIGVTIVTSLSAPGSVLVGASLVVVVGSIAYLQFVAQVSEVRLVDDRIEWFSLVRQGSFAISELTAVRPGLGGSQVLVRASGPSVRVSAMPWFKAWAVELERRHPDIPVRLGWQIRAQTFPDSK